MFSWGSYAPNKDSVPILGSNLIKVLTFVIFSWVHEEDNKNVSTKCISSCLYCSIRAYRHVSALAIWKIWSTIESYKCNYHQRKIMESHHTYTYIYIYIYIYKNEKAQDLQRIILFIELFANVKHLDVFF